MKSPLAKRVARAFIYVNETLGVFGPLYAYIMGHLATMWLLPDVRFVYFLGGSLTYLIYIFAMVVAEMVDFR